MAAIDRDLVNDLLDGDPLLTVEEAAAILGLKPETVLKRKDIPRVKVGQVRYRTSVIKRLAGISDYAEAAPEQRLKLPACRFYLVGWKPSTPPPPRRHHA